MANIGRFFIGNREDYRESYAGANWYEEYEHRIWDELELVFNYLLIIHIFYD